MVPPLTAGCALLLVGVQTFSPTGRNHYVTLTEKNIRKVFPADASAVNLSPPEVRNTQCARCHVIGREKAY